MPTGDDLRNLKLKEKLQLSTVPKTIVLAFAWSNILFTLHPYTLYVYQFVQTIFAELTISVVRYFYTPYLCSYLFTLRYLP